MQKKENQIRRGVRNSMKTKLSTILGTLLGMMMIISPIAVQPRFSNSLTKSLDQQPEFQMVGNPTARVIGEIEGETEPGTYIIQFSYPALASYRGGINHLAATFAPLRGQIKLDVNAPESTAYLDFLDIQQARFVKAMEETIGRIDVSIKFQYKYAFNGLAVELNPEEAALVAQMPNVRMVKRETILHPLTDVSPGFLGAEGIWDGTATGGYPGTKGEGVLIGILDTGINLDSPSFAEVGPVDGHTHINPFGDGNFVGWCDPGNTNYDPAYICNNKLIGAWDFADALGGEDDGPLDNYDHGSHTASIAGGNLVTTTIDAPTATYTPTLSGVAPHANILAYDVCNGGSCPESISVAATDQAVLDGVDIINFSIGDDPNDPWLNTVSLAFLGAIDAGVIVITGSGNDGPDPATIGSPADAPWIITAGNSTHNRVFINSLINLSGGDTVPPADLNGKGLTSGYGPAPIVYAGDFGDALCLTPFPEDTWTNGEIVVCDRGQIARTAKGDHVLAGGAGGFVLANVDSQGESTNGDPHSLPGVHIGDTDGDVLSSWLASGSVHTATISGYRLDTTGYESDRMNSLSSRGPNSSAPDMIKPDLAAPGTDVLAAYRLGEDYVFKSGTSMASPHVAGAAALIRALKPTWSVPEIRSALMTTAWTDMLKEDHITAADPFDIGSGRVDLNFGALAGLVLDESTANFINANPSLGGDPSTLNIASFANSECQQRCDWTRVVSSTLGMSLDWTAVISAPAGMTVTVKPDSFTLEPFTEKSILVTTEVDGMADGSWAFAELTLVPSVPEIPSAHFPIAVLPSNPTHPPVEVKTRRNAGSVTLEYIEDIEITDLTIETFGLVEQTREEFTILEVPDKTLTFPEIFFQSNVYTTALTLTTGDPRLVVEIMGTTSPDLDLMVLYDSNDNGIPEYADIDSNTCISATGGSRETCDILNPVIGRWFAMVVNYTASVQSPDGVTLYTAVVPDADLGNMSVIGPASVPDSTPYELQLFWGTPDIAAGDRYYGAFSLGSDPTLAGNIASLPVTISRFEDDVIKTVSSEVADPGDTLTYTVSVKSNIMPEILNYTITDTLPVGVTYVPESAMSNEGLVSVSDNVITWTLDLPAPLNGNQVTNLNTPLATEAASLSYQVTADAGIAGTITNLVWHQTDNPGSNIAMTSQDVFVSYRKYLPLLKK
jgi:uncharacterized repeat protein (TIGR01451 family)